VVDYTLVSGGLFPHVRSFAVGDFDLSCSDHAPLLVSLELPMSAAAVSATPAAAKPPTFPAIKWDKARRAEYTEAVTRNFHRRSCVLDRLNDGGDVSVVAQEWCQLLIDSAVEVFGVCQVGGKMLDGRPAKAWFKNCRAEWLVLRAAICRGDTHAAKVAKRAFNAAKRRAKRHCAKHWQARLWDDIQHNPRRFWTAYRGKRMDCMLSDFRAVDRHWRLLFGSSGQHSLPECAVSAADFVSELVGSLPDSVQSGAAAALNAPFENDEIAAMLGRLKLGRMAGPDGLQAELFRSAYNELLTAEGHVKHDYSLVKELCALFQHVFSTGCVPTTWSSAVVCAVYKKGDPTDLDNYRGIAVGCVLGKMYSMLLERRLDRFCEQHVIRAVGQAGFRKRRQCSDHVFVLKHLIDTARANLCGLQEGL